jgi:hypothetical protein
MSTHGSEWYVEAPVVSALNRRNDVRGSNFRGLTKTMREPAARHGVPILELADHIAGRQAVDAEVDRIKPAVPPPIGLWR